jgi:hypothetical protein
MKPVSLPQSDNNMHTLCQSDDTARPILHIAVAAPEHVACLISLGSKASIARWYQTPYGRSSQAKG